jgi:hypothetical protein
MMDGDLARVTEVDGGHSDFSGSLSAEIESTTYPVEMPSQLGVASRGIHILNSWVILFILNTNTTNMQQGPI